MGEKPHGFEQLPVVRHAEDQYHTNAASISSGPASPPSRGLRQTAAGTLLGHGPSYDQLVEIANGLIPHRDDILRSWSNSYTAAFGDLAFFESREFIASCGEELDRILGALSTGSPESLRQYLSDRGHELAAMGVPFSELVSSIHLFEESCLAHLTGGDPLLNHRVLDRLSHVRIAHLAEAYVDAKETSHAAREASMERDLAQLSRNSFGRSGLEQLVGRSAPMQVLYRRLEIAARGAAPTLLVGESGTGKELAARAIHLQSERREGRFVPVNCAALTETLLESELFGHRRGAFTGADSDSLGLIRHANGGTLFLDEITEMPISGQAKLLRVLQEKSVRPVGELSEYGSDFRVIASTNMDPQEAVEKEKLRPDLLFRLRTFFIELPPLRERVEDIALLSRSILDRSGLHGLSLTPAALDRLQARRWPGNVRELESLLLAAAAAAPRGRIRIVDLPRAAHHAQRPVHAGDSSPDDLPTLRESHYDLIRRALLLTRGNKRRAAARLGVSRKWLYARLAEMKA